MSHRLPRSFYLAPAEEVIRRFLGKYLVHRTPEGLLSGMIVDVEAYPAFSDAVSHGNTRTRRTEVMHREGGYAYVYLVYGLHHQLAVVVNRAEVPEVVFLRAVIPAEGITLMRRNYGREPRRVADLTRSPGNLCRSFGITLAHYGADLTGEVLYLEDRGVVVPDEDVVAAPRVGIRPTRAGYDRLLRFYLRPGEAYQKHADGRG